jgi:DNA-binding beta-propeller fold protein YncE
MIYCGKSFFWPPSHLEIQQNREVIQRFEACDAENDGWTVWIEGRYVKQYPHISGDIILRVTSNGFGTFAALLASTVFCPMVASDDTAAVNPDHLTGTVLVVNQASDTVTLIDLASMEAYMHVAVVGGPHEVAVSPGGKRAIVTNYYKRGGEPQKTLSLISLPDGATIRTIDLGEFSTPHDVQWVNDTHVVCTAEANQALLLVNVENGEVERVFVTGKGGSHMLSLSTDQARLYSSNMSGGGSVSVFDFESGEKIRDIDTGEECEGVGVTPDGRWVWAGNRAEDTVSIIDTGSLQLVKTLESPGFPYRVEFTPNGKYALVPHARSGTLMVGDVDAQSVIRHIPLGLTRVAEPSTAGVFPHPDNVHAFVTVRNDNSMLVVNIVTGETLARVEVQESPDGVSWSPVQR